MNLGPLIHDQVMLGDAFEWLNLIHPESVDLVITDPPYESLEKHRKIGTTTRLKNEWFDVIDNDLLDTLMELLYRVLKKHRHCYVFTDFDTMAPLVSAGQAAGFKCWKAIVWDKMRMGMGYHYRNRHEYILFFEKGKRKLNDWSKLESIQYVPGLRGKKYYPTEKPTALTDVFVKASAVPGEIVIDPFCGSGSTGISAIRLGCDAYLCDSSDTAVSRSRIRMAMAWAALSNAAGAKT